MVALEQSMRALLVRGEIREQRPARMHYAHI
jgi:hypothetical protein